MLETTIKILKVEHYQTGHVSTICKPDRDSNALKFVSGYPAFKDHHQQEQDGRAWSPDPACGIERWTGSRVKICSSPTAVSTATRATTTTNFRRCRQSRTKVDKISHWC